MHQHYEKHLMPSVFGSVLVRFEVAYGIFFQPG